MRPKSLKLQLQNDELQLLLLTVGNCLVLCVLYDVLFKSELDIKKYVSTRLTMLLFQSGNTFPTYVFSHINEFLF